jgi:hypothetical protein
MGLVNGGLELLSTCWSTMDLAWTVDSSHAALAIHAPNRPTPVLSFDHPDRAPRAILHRHPVDILIWDHSQDDPALGSEAADPQVTRWIAHCDQASRPSLVVELWGASASMHSLGPLSKPVRKAFRAQGYSQRSFQASGTALGGAVTQERLVIVYFQDSQLSPTLVRDWSPPLHSVHAARPMSNLLKPFGVPRNAYHHLSRHRPLDPSCHIPDSVTSPMPSAVGAWISTPLGVRRLLPDELAKGLGVPSDWLLATHVLPARFLNYLVGTHIWEALGIVLGPLLENRSSPEGATHKSTLPPGGTVGRVVPTTCPNTKLFTVGSTPALAEASTELSSDTARMHLLDSVAVTRSPSALDKEPPALAEAPTKSTGGGMLACGASSRGSTLKESGPGESQAGLADDGCAPRHSPQRSPEFTAGLTLVWPCLFRHRRTTVT